MEHKNGNSPLSSSLSLFGSFTPESESPTLRLSMSHLQSISELQTLSDSNYLQVSLNANEIAIDNLGDLLPGLRMLKLTGGSIIPSLRCLGSSLYALHFLYASHCLIEFIEGIGTMSQLQELYLPFNFISDLSPLSILENLTILDIECNRVRDQNQVTHLALCSSLKTLSIQGNPICEELGNDFQTRILSLIPNLVLIEGVKTPTLLSEEKDNLVCNKLSFTPSIPNQIYHLPSPPITAPFLTRRPKTGFGTRRKTPSMNLTSNHFTDVTQSLSFIPQRPKTASGDFTRSFSRMLSSEGGHTYPREMSFEDRENASELTQGPQSSLCGSLTQSLRAKKCKNKSSNPKLDYIHEGMENDYIVSTSNTTEIDSLLEDLQNWRLRFDTNTDLISNIDDETHKICNPPTI